MGKKPFFPFFTGDWVQDTRILSLQAKGAWIDLLTAMWHNRERGRLTLTWVGFSRLLGASVDSTKAAVGELVENRICDVFLDCVSCVARNPNVAHGCSVLNSLNSKGKFVCNSDSNGNVTFLLTHINGNGPEDIEVKCTSKSVRLTDCNGNVTVMNRRMVREENERQSTNRRVRRHREMNVERKSNGNGTPAYSSSSLKRKNKQKKKSRAAPISQDIVSLVEEVVGYLNLKAKKQFKHTAENTVGIIADRCVEGYSLNDFKRVIDNKVATWLTDRKMNRFLRPETLFAKTHFESYLNEDPCAGEGFEDHRPGTDEYEGKMYIVYGGMITVPGQKVARYVTPQTVIERFKVDMSECLIESDRAPLRTKDIDMSKYTILRPQADGVYDLQREVERQNRHD